jgi:hypothetical protein
MSSQDCGGPNQNRRAVAISLAVQWLQHNPQVDVGRIFRTAKTIDEWIASGKVPDAALPTGLAVNGQQLNAIVDHIPSQ